VMLGIAKRSNDAGDMDLIERPEPKAEPGYVVLDVNAVGICGTDIHIYKGEYKVVPTVTTGHEVCGVVSEVGEGVDASWIGQRVVSETFYSSCGVCMHAGVASPICAAIENPSAPMSTGPWHRVWLFPSKAFTNHRSL
jgi:L-iditol 2-dehydrogenase